MRVRLLSVLCASLVAAGVVACGDDATGTTVIEVTEVTVAVPTTPPNDLGSMPTLPHGPDTGSWSVSVENPCDVPVRVELRLASVGEEGKDPANITTAGPGKTAKLNYGFAKDTGPWEVVVTAPELGWINRESAGVDTSMVIDPERCPGG